MTCEEKSTATDSTVQGAELLRAGGIESPAVEAGEVTAEAIRGERGERRQVGLCPCIIRGASLPDPASVTRSDASPLIEDFKPIRALLPVWTDEITGAVLDLDELRKALMGDV
jgi:hypothetical protein